MMEKRRGRLAPDEMAQLDLASGRRQKVFSADHDIDTLIGIIYHDRELIRPVPVSIAREGIARLICRHLNDVTQPKIPESNLFPFQPDPSSRRCDAIPVPGTARSRITTFAVHRLVSLRLDPPPGTAANVRETIPREHVQYLRVPHSAIPLMDNRQIRAEPQPCEIIEQRRLVCGSRAHGIVVFDAQKHAAVECARHSPDGQRARDVSEMKVSGGRGRKAREETPLRSFDEKRFAQRFTAMPTTSKRAPNNRAPEPRNARAGNSFVK